MTDKESNMKAMICEMCGSNELVKQDGLFVCQHCGVKYNAVENYNKWEEEHGEKTYDGW